MTEAPETFLHRHFTDDFRAPYDMFRWAERTVWRDDHELQVIFPEHWAQNDIERMLYTVFWPEERDLRQVIDRVVNPVTKAGFAAGYFASEEEADVFHDELKYLLTSQMVDMDETIWRCVGRQDVSLQLAKGYDNVQPVSDLFMRAVEADGEWSAQAPPKRTGEARSIWQDIVRDIWRHGDVPVKFPDTVKMRHMVELSEQVPSAQLALLALVSETGRLKLDALKQAVHMTVITLDILIDYTQGNSQIREKRPIAIGYRQLAASLLSMGVPYDSEVGRSRAALISSFITGAAYKTSQELAAKVGPFAGYKKRLGKVSQLLRTYQKETARLSAPQQEAEAVGRVWEQVIKEFKQKGVRNCQVSILNETSDIAPLESLMMTMKLPTGGGVEIVQPMLAAGLRCLGYNKAQTTEIINYVHEKKGEITGAPHINEQDAAVFATQLDSNAHMRMRAVLQPFLSGEIRQPLLISSGTTPRDVEKLLLEAWQSGLEHIHIVRKENEQRPKEEEMQANPTNEKKEEKPASENVSPKEPSKEKKPQEATQRAQLRPLPRIRNAKTFAFTIAKHEGYFTVGEYDDGTPGELFVHIAKLDAAMMVMISALTQSVSHGLQHGVSLAVYVKSMTSLQVAPQGTTDDPDIPEAQSIIDYVVRRMALHYLTLDERIAVGLDTEEEAQQRAHERQAKLVE